jgi:3-hydroxybutyryl-CoA dehydrogenase
MKIENVGIIGCGIMGAGIAQLCAQSGYNVVVSELNNAILQKGLNTIASGLNRLMEKGKLTPEDKQAILSRIKGTTLLNDFSDVDIIIEAAPENMAIKKSIFAKLGEVCKASAILTSNTSVLCIAELASASKRPEQVLGMHFSNPVHVQKIIEVVKSIATCEAALESSIAFGKSLGKVPVVVKDMPGFISGRIFTPFLLNAIRVVQDEIAKPKEVDMLFTLGAGHAMGPLATLDLVGIDTVYHAASAIYEETKDPQYAPPPLMRRMVELGWLGRKSGKGFYDYSETKQDTNPTK